MENKKKPSILTLHPGHHDDEFNGPGILFVPEMLEWPFYGVENKTLIKIYRTALEALTWIGPFDAKISVDADLDKKVIILTHRTWGKIILDGKCILGFSHDTRYDNCPFNSLCEWPELNSNLSRELSLWTTGDWINFFRERIAMKAQTLKIKATAKRDDATSLDTRAELLLKALTQ